MSPLAPSTSPSDKVIGCLHVVTVDVRQHQLPDQLLLCGDAADGIDDLEAVLVHDSIVLVEDLALKEPEALGGIRAPAQVHPGPVTLELHPPCHQPVQRDVDWYPEIQREIRLDAKAVQLADPLPI